MKNLLLKTLLIVSTLSSLIAQAELYKGLDENGNVVYADKPFANAEQFTPPSLTIVDAPKVTVKEEELPEKKPEAETKYLKFSITSPVNDQTIWNAVTISVSLQLSPALNITEGHTTWLFMDGKPVVKNSQGLLLQIARSDRGQHTLQAQVRNKKGGIIKQTAPVTIHIKNSVVNPKATPLPAS
ncbi:MAG: DUF4124 domain-containing protein [Gammaproteobacteria bacterium]|nr:DUF4124 domain-containing protein [Gammaproteobacteria bacterium]